MVSLFVAITLNMNFDARPILHFFLKSTIQKEKLQENGFARKFKFEVIF